MNDIEINPFDDLIVTEPRRRETVVQGLNERPLRALLARMEQLAPGPAPRRARSLPHAELLISEQPGYGKSHLIGRLFRELHGRATLISVRPLQNPATGFQSVMRAVAREMNFPDRVDVSSWDPEEATQLDHFAHGVLAHLLADLVERDRKVHSDNAANDVATLRGDPLGAFQRGAPGQSWADWLRAHFETLRPSFEAALAQRGIELFAPGWLRVLFAYAFSPFDRTTRQACLDWLVVDSLGPEESARMGLRAAESVPVDVTAEQVNDLCRTRITDLTQLASLFRPFVFCFDQTEIYGHHPALARSFGMVVAALVNEAVNHLTLVTSNQDPWLKRIAPHIEHADLERLGQPPLTLEGLTRRQGEELVRLRLEACKREPKAIPVFLDSSWLAELFPTERNQMGARYFLQKCKERWAQKPLPAVTLSELYRQHRDQLLAEPKRHQFEPDTLQWLVEEAPRGLPGLQIESSRTVYFCVRWETPERVCLFGFEGGSHWKRWQTITRNVQGRLAREPRTKAVFFRTPELGPIPGAWQAAAEIEAAKSTSLHIVSLTVDEVAELYAARELFADAAQGDIPFSTGEVIAFLHAQLAPWWDRLRGPIAVSAQPAVAPAAGDESSLAGEVRAIVQRARFLSIDEAIGQLSAPATRDSVLKACGYSAEIKIHAHPSMTVLQWQNV
ncbi:MAG: hypothetical protein M3463_07710 [Verrucomicrobiota bacterium]|nr:hypothetical protein [Verrucomicrobiota bacterium]